MDYVHCEVCHNLGFIPSCPFCKRKREVVKKPVFHSSKEKGAELKAKIDALWEEINAEQWQEDRGKYMAMIKRVKRLESKYYLGNY